MRLLQTEIVSDVTSLRVSVDSKSSLMMVSVVEVAVVDVEIVVKVVVVISSMVSVIFQNFTRRTIFNLAPSPEPSTTCPEDGDCDSKQTDRPHKFADDLQPQKEHFRFEFVLLVLGPYTYQDIGSFLMPVAPSQEPHILKGDIYHRDMDLDTMMM